MVDWVIASGARRGRRPARRRRARPTARTSSTERRDRRPGACRAAPATRFALRARALDGFDGDVLVLSGDVAGPHGRSSCATLVDDAPRRRRGRDRALVRAAPTRRSYGRVVRDADGFVARIVEAARRDAPTELAIAEVNSGDLRLPGAKLWPALEQLEPQNAQGELYLTDTIGILVADGETVAAPSSRRTRSRSRASTRARSSRSPRAVLRDRINARTCSPGVTIVDPATTWIEPDGRDRARRDHPSVRRPARPNPGRRPAPRSTRSTVAIDAQIGPGATVGPFCYLRPGTVLEARFEGGNLRGDQELDASGERTKVPHLSYIGDADIGADTNIGAGAITANFPHQPGKPKGRTTIGKNVRTGIQNGFVAPVEVGDGAWIAAGSTITKDVPADALAVARHAPGEQGGVCSSAAGRLSSCSRASTTRSSRQ